MARNVLILGSAPDALRCQSWDLAPFDEIVAVNNAWRVRADWTVCIHPDDFPEDRRPVAGPGQRCVGSDLYVPAHAPYGGVVYGGGTMAFSASYWVLDALRPQLIAYLGCDMVYPPQGRTHFYGTGTADPLRDDPTLQSIEAKATRLQALAARQGCALVNLSGGSSRLPFPRSTLAQVAQGAIAPLPFDGDRVDAIRAQEEALGMDVPSGRYWEAARRLDPGALSEIDDRWLALAAIPEPAAIRTRQRL